MLFRSDYASWGFAPASPTTRWQVFSEGLLQSSLSPAGPQAPVVSTPGWRVLAGDSIPERAVQRFDAQREASPRPHFLHQWLRHPAGTVLALIDAAGLCHGFGRIRPCLLDSGEGWRIGPLLAETPQAAALLLRSLLQRHPGEVLIDAPGANPAAAELLEGLGFRPIGTTLRMYRGEAPHVSLRDVYGLACLELG